MGRTGKVAAPTALPVAEDDPAPGQVVRAQLHEHPVERKDLDVVLPDLSADVGQHRVAVLELHPEVRITHTFEDGALELDSLGCSRHVQRTTSSRLLPVRRASKPSNSAVAATLDSDTSAEAVVLPTPCRAPSVWASSARPMPRRCWSARTAISPIRGSRVTIAIRSR